jgi:endonuclease IV
LNLASLDPAIYETSINHLRKALDLTRLFGGGKFGFHAGFFVDRPAGEVGKKFGKSSLYDRETALNKFTDAFRFLQSEFREIDLYIENNCYSASNHTVYCEKIPFMLLNFQDYKDLRMEIDFKLLLDIGHLLVTAKTLGFDFNKEFQDFFNISDYIHISCNDSLHDQNLGLDRKSDLVEVLSKCDWKNKTITLEIYEGSETLKDTHSIISSLSMI